MRPDPARSNTASRGFIAAGLGLLLVIIGAVAATAAVGDGPAQGSPPSDDVSVAGPQAVAGPNGETAGWIDADDWASANLNGPPTRTFGSAHVELQSLEVHDRAGALVGYYTTGRLGFVPLATATDAAAMDALLAQAAEHP